MAHDDSDPTHSLAAVGGSGGSGPTILSQEDIVVFQNLVRETCGLALTDTQAWSRASALVALYRMMLRPILEDPERDKSSDNVSLPSSEPGKVS